MIFKHPGSQPELLELVKAGSPSLQGPVSWSLFRRGGRVADSAVDFYNNSLTLAFLQTRIEDHPKLGPRGFPWTKRKAGKRNKVTVSHQIIIMMISCHSDQIFFSYHYSWPFVDPNSGESIASYSKLQWGPNRTWNLSSIMPSLAIGLELK